MSDRTSERTDTRPGVAWALGGVAVVLVLGGIVRYLEQNIPDLTEGTAFGEVAAAIEYPVYAILLGLLGNVVLTQLGGARSCPAGSAPSSSSRPGSCCSARRSTSR